jgi:hypothetical protein
MNDSPGGDGIASFRVAARREDDSFENRAFENSDDAWGGSFKSCPRINADERG